MASIQRFGLVVAAALFAALPVAAQRATSYGDVKVLADPEPKGTSGHGYTEYAFTLTNSGQQPHSVTLSLLGDNGRTYGDHIRSISRTVKVGPGSSVRATLYQPHNPPLLGEDVTVAIDGKNQAPAIELRTVRLTDPGFRPGRFGSGPLILLSQDVSADFTRLAVEPRDVPGKPPPGRLLPAEGPGGPPEDPPDVVEGGIPLNHNFQFVARERGATAWPGNWLGYSRYDGVVLTARALAAMKPDERTALWQYGECGGALLVLGKQGVADSWKPEKQGQLRCILYRPGFGQCIVTDEADFRRWDNGLWLLVTGSWLATADAGWQRNDDPLEANSRFPVVDDLGIPARGLFLLMLGFAIVLGPVNFWLLAKWKKRLWMLWTVPVISVTTCACVFGYMVLTEGWSGHLRTEAITVLDQTGQRAATVGWTAFYTPLTPGDGLHFSQETELALQGEDDGYYDRRSYIYERRSGGSGKACTVDWSDDQHLARGWVSARLPAHFRLRKSEVRRERVTVRRDRDGGLTAVNGLGAEIATLWLADEKGRLYQAGPLAAGAEARLNPSDKTLAPAQKRVTLGELYRGDWLETAKKLRAAPQQVLLPLRYLADVAGAPFVEEGLRKAGERKTHSLVLGLLKEIEQ